jgi:hypothetical protein
MKNYSEIAERQAEIIVADMAMERFDRIVRLMQSSEELCERIAFLAWDCTADSTKIRDRQIELAMLDHCEEALIRMYDEETEAQKDAYAKGDR